MPAVHRGILYNKQIFFNVNYVKICTINDHTLIHSQLEISWLYRWKVYKYIRFTFIFWASYENCPKVSISGSLNENII